MVDTDAPDSTAGEKPATPTLLDRMASMLGEDKAQAWITAQRVIVDGKVVTDPDRPTPRGHRWHISGE